MRNRATLVGIPVLVATAILVGLAAGNIFPFARPSSSPTASTADASTGVDASEAPSISPIPSPSPTPLPPPVALYAACDDFDEMAPLALRVESWIDTGPDWVISVYEDGHVLTPGLTRGDFSDDGAWMVARRLTPAGIAQLRETVTATGLFGKSGWYGPVALPNVEPPGRGAPGYGITLGSGADAVTVSGTSMFPDDALYYEPSPEREALDVLGAKMLVFDSWLPDDAWATRHPCTVQALRFRVAIFIGAHDYGGSFAVSPPEFADVPWPLGGDVLSWGAEVSHQQPGEPYLVGRCGIVARADASRLVSSLRDAGAADPFTPPTTLDEGSYFQLGDRAANRIVDVKIQPLLPDDSQCTAESLYANW